MSKIMLVNVTHVEESRVAILDNGVLEQYEIETINRAHIKGNIHNAIVENVHASLEAAFLRISPELKGFLPLDEVNFKLLPDRGDGRGRGRIGQHLHPGQKLMVQVVREPFAGKPPTVTTYFSLPGRYLVLMPGVDSAGVSRKIEDPAQRDRLRKLVEELAAPEGFGVIVRTAGLGQAKAELQRDLRYLLRLWESIQRASRSTDFPGIVYRERDLVIRTIRDYFTPDIGEVWIDSPETYERALEFVRDVMPSKAKVLKLHTGERPLFSKFNLEDQIESIYKRRVALKSGGEIVIDGTEALTAIDVNSARSVRQGDAEENALQTNTEAAVELARQLRLRDLGGLIVVDFIDMMSPRNQRKIEKVMRDAMRADRAKYDVTRISKLGIMELARQRIRGEKLASTYATCPACEGFGLVKNVESAALAALRKLQARCLRGDFGRMRVALPPEVAQWILNNKREELLQLEKRYNIRVAVEAKLLLLRHQSEFETFPREKVEEPQALVAGDRPAPPLPPDLKEIKEIEAAAPAAAEGAQPAGAVPEEGGGVTEPAASGGRKRRRRRRRRSRSGAPEFQAPATDGAGEPGSLAGHEPTGGVPAHPEQERESLPEAFPPREEPAPAESYGSHEDAVQDAAQSGVEPETGTPSSDSAPTGGSSATRPAEGGEPGGPGRRRRRRRRRRRGRSGGAASFDQRTGNGIPSDRSAGAQSRPTLASTTEAPSHEAEESGGRVAVASEGDLVPRHIRSEELMPAATGSAAKEKFLSGWRRRIRRRRKGGGEGTSPAPADTDPGDSDQE